MLPGGQFGKDVPAIEQATVLFVSTVSVHFSIVPSVQVLFCAWSPGPHVGFSPVPWHVPSFSQGPSSFGTVDNNVR